jgi:hypothetical protein
VGHNLNGLIQRHMMDSAKLGRRVGLVARRGLIVMALGSGCLLCSCSNAKQADDSSSSSIRKDCSSLEPHNPYDEGSGHYAGFKWGEDGKSCGGNSTSFIEGCEEYEAQEEAYDACTKQ